jgi:hypothetical protein
MSQAVCRRPLIAAAWVHARVNPVRFVVDKVALGQVFLRVFRFIIPPWAPYFRKLQKKIVLSFIHSHSHPGTNNRHVKAAAVH